MAIVRDPIYQQLNTELRKMLSNCTKGEKFLSEREISERFSVSRATANKALSNLVVEGVLIFRKGIGTFVSDNAMDYDIRSLVSFTHKARSAGKEPSTQVLMFEQLQGHAVDEHICKELQAAPATEIWHTERLRKADGQSVILERRYILAEYCPDLTEENLTGSLYELWVENLQLDIAGSNATIQAVNIPDADADLLQVPCGSAGLLVRATGYLVGNRPLWFERTLYRGDAYTFRNRTDRMKAFRPAVGTLMDTDRPEAKNLSCNSK